MDIKNTKLRGCKSQWLICDEIRAFEKIELIEIDKLMYDVIISNGVILWFNKDGKVVLI